MRFFVLANPKAADGDAVTDFIPVESSQTGPAPKCSACGKFIGMMPLVPPIRLEVQLWGKRWGDIAFGSGDQLLVSVEFKQLVSSAGLTGFERFDDVEIVTVKKPRSVSAGPPNYELASIQRSRAALDDKASGSVREEPRTCDECREGGIFKRVSRVVLEPESWSGEDIFFARGLPGVVLTSERFKPLCEENNAANCRLIEAGQFSFNHYPWEQTAEGRKGQSVHTCRKE